MTGRALAESGGMPALQTSGERGSHFSATFQPSLESEGWSPAGIPGRGPHTPGRAAVTREPDNWITGEGPGGGLTLLRVAEYNEDASGPVGSANKDT